MLADKLLAYLTVAAIALTGSAASFRLLYASLDDVGTFVAGAIALGLVVVGAVWGSRGARTLATPYW